MQDPTKHLNSLDGVRGLAILMVFCHHMCPFNEKNAVAVVCSTLWLGVDLFFVLSGFFITGVLYDTLMQPEFFRNFYIRRALRLMPAYLAVLALLIVANAALAFYGDPSAGRLTGWALPYFAYASNIVRDLNLPIGLSSKLDVSHFWSLALEEQFYLVWPLAIVLARTRRRILWMCGAGIVLSVVLRFIAVGYPGHFFLGTPYFELPMRMDGLLLGGALAMLLRDKRSVKMLTPARLHLLLGASFLALLLTFSAAGHGSMFAVPTVRYGYFFASLMFVAFIGLGSRRESWVESIGSVPLLRTIGSCSYGLYLIHLVPKYWYFKVLQWAQAQCRSSAEYYSVSLAVFALYFLICFGIAMLSYTTLEQYFLKMKKRFKHDFEHNDFESSDFDPVEMGQRAAYAG